MEDPARDEQRLAIGPRPADTTSAMESAALLARLASGIA